MKKFLKCLSFVVTVLAFAPLARAEGVIVFAAASLSGALDAVNAAYVGPAPRVAYAASSTLARQMVQGAPAEVFISANPAWMDYLAEDGVIDESSRVELLTNRLVVIGAAEQMNIGDLRNLPGLLGTDRLALALTQAVPAGQYAKAALINAGIWPEISARTAETDNVRAALLLVARGEAPFGIVYATDVAASARVAEVAKISGDLHDPIVYPAALVAEASGAARDYFAFLTSPQAAQIFTEYGFGVVGQ